MGLIIKNNLDLIVDKKYITDLFNRNSQLLFGNNKKVQTISIKTIRDYQCGKEHVKLIRYLIRAPGKKDSIELYGHSSNIKSKKIDNNTFFLKLLKKQQFDRGKHQAPIYIKYFANLNLLLRHGARGETLLKQYKKSAAFKKGVAKSAEWLVKFQEIKTNLSIQRQIIADKKEFAYHRKTAQKYLDSPTAKGVNRILKKVINFHTKYCQKNQEVLVHGDFHLENIFYHPKSDILSVIDLDWVRLGHPLSDVGNFVQQFDWQMKHKIPRKKREELISIFLQAYYLKTNQKLEDIMPHVEIFRARFAIQMAMFFLEFVIPRVPRTKKKKIYNDALFLIDQAKKYVK